MSTVLVEHSVDGYKKDIVNVQAKILKNIDVFSPTDPWNSSGIENPKMDGHAPITPRLPTVNGPSTPALSARGPISFQRSVR